MKKQIDQVTEFHNAFGVVNGTSPKLIDKETFQLRFNLMLEENEEYLEACQKEDLVGIADALGDMMYVLAGTMLTHGMHNKIEEVITEIHRSNMSKLGEDGKPIIRDDGKVLKGPSYFKPNISSILEKKKDE